MSIIPLKARNWLQVKSQFAYTECFCGKCSMIEKGFFNMFCLSQCTKL